MLGNAADDSVSSGTLLVTGASTVNGATVTTFGATQTYNGDVTLGTGVNFTGSTVNFDEDIIGGANTLTVTGDAVFGDATDDAIASGTLLVTGATTVNAATVTTAGATQTYNGNVTLGSGVNFTGTTVNFDEDIIGGANTLTITGDAVFGTGADDAVASGTLLVTGASTVNAATVTTAGATQTYNGNVTLGSGVNFTGTTVNFDEDIIGGANTLTITGDAVLGDAADDAIASGTLLVTGATTVNAATVTTAGATQTYNGDVTLGSGVNFTGTTVQFDEDIIGGENTLTITGDAVFGDAADDAIASGTLLVTGASTVNAATVTTAGATQTYNGDVTLTTGVNFTGTTVSFDEDILGGANTLTVTGDAVFGNAADDAVTSGTLLVTGATTINASTVTTAGATQTYTGQVTLGSDVTLTGSTITFLDDVDATTAGMESLTITGNMILGDGAGDYIGGAGGMALEFLFVSGATTINSTPVAPPTIVTTGAQTYTGAFSMGAGADTTLSSTGGAAISFGSTVDGAQALTVNTTGATTFSGIVGGMALTSLTTDAGGTTTFNADATSVTATTQTYNDAVILDTTADTVTFNGTTITYESTVDSGATEANAMTVNSGGVVTFNGAVGATDELLSLTTDATGTTVINGGQVSTTETQTYNDAVTVGTMAALFDSDGAGALGDITFVTTLGGGVDVTVNSAGTTTFTGTVGTTPAALTSLTTDAAGTTAINGGSVITTGTQTYNDDVTFGATLVLTSTGDGAVTLAKTASDLAGGFDLTVNTGGVTTFGGAVTAANVTTDDDASDLATDMTVINGGSVTTTADQTYGDNVVIGANTTLAGNDITFNGSLDADATGMDRTLDINTTTGGVTTFGNGLDATGAADVSADAVGGTGRFESITTNADGSSVIETSIFNADGASITFNDAVTLGTDVVVDENGTGNVTFASTVNSDGTARDLTVNTASGQTIFRGIVGGTSPLDVLTTDATGTTLIDTTAVSGAVLDFNDPVVVSQNATLNGTTSVDFATTLDSDVLENNNLVINSPSTTFNGNVGQASPFGTLMTDGPAGTTTINAALVSGAILDFDDAVVLEASTTLSGSTSVDFASTVDSAGGEANTLTVNSPMTTFNGAVGTADTSGGATDSALGSLTTDATIAAPNTTSINGGAIRTTGAQTYNDNVILGANTTLTSTITGAITFNGTLDGAAADTQTLDVNTAGTTSFNGVVGGTAALARLTTDLNGAGITVFDTMAVNANIVAINDPLIIGQNNTVTATTSASFNNTVDSAGGEVNNLIVNSPSTTFNGIVGGSDSLGLLQTDDQSPTPDVTTINTTGITAVIVDFNDAVIIDEDTTAVVTGTTSVDFHSTVDSAAGEFNGLTVNSPATTFGDAAGADAVGAIRAIENLITDNQGPDDTTVINSVSVTTSADQTYMDAVTLGTSGSGSDTTTFTGVNISYNSTVDAAATGAQDLILNATGAGTFGDGLGHDAVGGEFALGSVTTDSGAVSGTTRINSTSVNTMIMGANTGDQTYNDAVIIGFNDAAGGDVNTLNGENVSFSSTIDGATAGGQDLIVNTANDGATTFGDGAGSDIVGGTTLRNLTTNADGITIINSDSVNTSADQVYNDDVLLGTGASVITTFAGVNISFNDTVDAAAAGTQGMILNATGVGTFGDATGDDIVGGGNGDARAAGSGALSSLVTDSGAVSGTTQINALSVTTTGNQVYNDAVNVGTSGGAAPGNIVTTLNGNNITFNSTVDGDGATATIEDLTVNSTGGGTTIFGDAAGDDNVGGITAIGNLITNADGDTDINSTSVTTSADQTYNDRVIIGTSGGAAPGNLITTLSGVNITFNSTVDASAAGVESLVVNGTGTTTFGDAAGDDNVGAGTNPTFVGEGALLNLTTDGGVAASGTTVINSTSVTTTLDQTYNDAVVVGTSGGAAPANVITTLIGDDITFNSTVDAAAAGSAGPRR